MDTATSQFILGMSGAVIVLLLSVITYFLRQFIRSVNSIRDAVFELKIIVKSQSTDLENHKTSCKARHVHISNHMSDVNNKLSKHQDSITVLKERVK